MISAKINSLLLLLVLTQVCLCAVKNPSQPPQRNTKMETIDEKKVKIDPGQILTIKFNDNLYDIQSIKVERLTANGTWEDRTILDYQKFLDEDRFDLGGCVSYESQGQFQKILYTNFRLNQSVNNNQAKFTGVLFFPNQKKFLLLGSDYHFYYFGYISMLVGDQQALNVEVEQGFNFKDIAIPPTGGSGGVQDQEPWVKGAQVQGKAYIFTPNHAFMLNTIEPKQPSDFVEMTIYQPRTSINDILVQDNQIWLAVGSDGIDVYSISDQSALIKPLSYNKNSSNLIIGLQNMEHDFIIQKIRIVQQGNTKVLILQENKEGLHVMLFGQLLQDQHKLTYLYFININNIASFDAVGYTLAATLSSKTFQSGLEIFFDIQNYYINEFEDDELAVDDVVLDRNSKTGIWIGDDISKGFRHSIYKGNLQYSQMAYEDYIDMSGNNYLFFFTEGTDNLIFTLGQRTLEIFNLTNVVPKVMCSSSKGGVEDEYRVKLISSYCSTDDVTNNPLQTAAYLFNDCEVTMRLNFQTTNIAIDSSNIGLIVGLTLTFVFILVVILILVIRRYRLNKSEITNLEEKKKKYVTIDSDDHKNMNNIPQGQQGINFDIQ